MNAFILFFIFCMGSTCWSWSEHHLITEAALSPVISLQSKTVRPTSFEEMVQALGYTSPLDFNEKNEIKKEFVFKFKLGETPSLPVSVVEVLAKYSDEPDWDMDKELFGPDEYPNLWRSEYKYMGNKTGTPSQAFRHMFWGKTLKIPNPLVDMGEAPVRAALFIDLARKAKEKGYDYWSVRFIANALHYLEDVSQPYHSTQVQTQSFLFIPFYPRYYFGEKDYSENASKNYVQKVTNVITYYHFAFENYVAYIMLDSDQQNTASAQLFRRALAAPPQVLNQDYRNGDMASLVKDMSQYSAKMASAAGQASVKFFPDFENYLKKNNLHIDQFDPNSFIDQAWYHNVEKNSQAQSASQQKYFAVVKTVFGQLGENIRSVVNAEVY